MPLAIVCACIAWFVSDPFENHIVCFLMTRLICYHTFLTYCVLERASEGERILTKNFEVGFFLRLTSQSAIFQSMTGRSQRFLGLTSTVGS